jgi:DNA-binding MarR family transcriptional regulator
MTEGGYSRGEIARRMVEKAPDVTRLVDRLEQQGLVTRCGSNEDARLSITCITFKGLDLLDRMAADIEAVHDYFAERVSLRDRRELSRICEGLYSTDE